MRNKILSCITLASLTLNVNCATMFKRFFPDPDFDDRSSLIFDDNDNGIDDLEEIVDYVKYNGISMKMSFDEGSSWYVGYYMDIPGNHPLLSDLQEYFPGMRWLSATVNEIEVGRDEHFPMLILSVEDAEGKVYAFSDSHFDGMRNSLDTYIITSSDLSEFEAWSMDSIPVDRKEEVNLFYPLAVSTVMEVLEI